MAHYKTPLKHNDVVYSSMSEAIEKTGYSSCKIYTLVRKGVDGWEWVGEHKPLSPKKSYNRRKTDKPIGTENIIFNGALCGTFDKHEPITCYLEMVCRYKEDIDLGHLHKKLKQWIKENLPDCFEEFFILDTHAIDKTANQNKNSNHKFTLQVDLCQKGKKSNLNWRELFKVLSDFALEIKKWWENVEKNENLDIF